MSAPVIHEYDAWRAALMEHRRALFERLVAAFPEELRNRRSHVEQLRIQISGPRIGAATKGAQSS
ncbi:hypothetical protein EBZ80_11465 [bacterium]|nr:hypothetical protein [bacterium]